MRWRHFLLGIDFGDEDLDAGLDLLADRADGVDSLPGRDRQLAVKALLAGQGQASPQPIDLDSAEADRAELFDRGAAVAQDF